jgi:hypothetical protein
MAYDFWLDRLLSRVTNLLHFPTLRHKHQYYLQLYEPLLTMYLGQRSEISKFYIYFTIYSFHYIVCANHSVSKWWGTTSLARIKIWTLFEEIHLGKHTDCPWFEPWSFQFPIRYGPWLHHRIFILISEFLGGEQNLSWTL